MVEINNQRKAFLDMLAVGRDVDNGRQKTKCGYDVIVGGNYFRPRSFRKLVTPNQTQINRRRLNYEASFPLSGCLPQLGLKASLRKSGRCGIAAD